MSSIAVKYQTDWMTPRVPPNVRFEVDDIENHWVYRSEFDYIHARYFAGAIKDWPNLLRQAFKYEMVVALGYMSACLYGY